MSTKFNCVLKKKKFSATQWYAFFYGIKSSEMSSYYNKVKIHYSSYYSFLEMDQIKGKIYRFLSIPNVCGKICKRRLKQMSTIEVNLKRKRKITVDRRKSVANPLPSRHNKREDNNLEEDNNESVNLRAKNFKLVPNKINPPTSNIVKQNSPLQSVEKTLSALYGELVGLNNRDKGKVEVVCQSNNAKTDEDLLNDLVSNEDIFDRTTNSLSSRGCVTDGDKKCHIGLSEVDSSVSRVSDTDESNRFDTGIDSPDCIELTQSDLNSTPTSYDIEETDHNNNQSLLLQFASSDRQSQMDEADSQISKSSEIIGSAIVDATIDLRQPGAFNYIAQECKKIINSMSSNNSPNDIRTFQNATTTTLSMLSKYQNDEEIQVYEQFVNINLPTFETTSKTVENTPSPSKNDSSRLKFSSLETNPKHFNESSTSGTPNVSMSSQESMQPHCGENHSVNSSMNMPPNRNRHSIQLDTSKENIVSYDPYRVSWNHFRLSRDNEEYVFPLSQPFNSNNETQNRTGKHEI